MTARSPLARLSRALYLASRAAGDANAASRGPKSYVKRIVRRQVTRALFRAFR